MWIGLIALVVAATESLVAVIAVVALCTLFTGWRVRRDAGVRRAQLTS
jgi:hypothetical protein